MGYSYFYAKVIPCKSLNFFYRLEIPSRSMPPCKVAPMQFIWDCNNLMHGAEPRTAHLKKLWTKHILQGTQIFPETGFACQHSNGNPQFTGNQVCS